MSFKKATTPRSRLTLLPKVTASFQPFGGSPNRHRHPEIPSFAESAEELSE
jgi:hypothetical protein